MATSKKKAAQAKSGAAAWARTILGDVTKRIGKRNAKLRNPVSAAGKKAKPKKKKSK